ncbi:MAG TPA: hypothetical protein VIY48_04250 [Candidatus Paceibacterota bacterium]
MTETTYKFDACITAITISAVLLQAPDIDSLDVARQALSEYLPFCCEMPCGESVTFPGVNEIPLFRVPCPCGDPTHWFVKIRIDPSLDRRTKEE